MYENNITKQFFHGSPLITWTHTTLDLGHGNASTYTYKYAMLSHVSVWYKQISRGWEWRYGPSTMKWYITSVELKSCNVLLSDQRYILCRYKLLMHLAPDRSLDCSVSFVINIAGNAVWWADNAVGFSIITWHITHVEYPSRNCRSCTWSGDRQLL